MRRAQAAQSQHLTIVAHAVAQRAAKVGEGAASCAAAAMAAASRQSGGGFAGQTPQCVAGCATRKAAFHQRFRARRGEAGFIGFIGQQGFLVATAFLLQPDGFLVLAVIGPLDGFAAAKMKVEQPVIGGAPLRRRRERRKPGAADMLQAARPEQVDGGKERRGLFRRDQESVGAQQRRKGNEHACGARQLKIVAHAAASAISASSRGEMK